MKYTNGEYSVDILIGYLSSLWVSIKMYIFIAMFFGVKIKDLKLFLQSALKNQYYL